MYIETKNVRKYGHAGQVTCQKRNKIANFQSDVAIIIWSETTRKAVHRDNRCRKETLSSPFSFASLFQFDAMNVMFIAKNHATRENTLLSALW